MVSVLLLILVPVIAMMVAYSVQSGVPIESVPSVLYEDVLDLLQG